MFYIILLLSIIIIIYNYNNLIKHDKDIKTFVVISSMLIIAIIYSFFIDDLKNYSLIKILKIVSDFFAPWFIEFMKT